MNELTHYEPIELIETSPHIETTRVGMVIRNPDMLFEEAEDIMGQLRGFGNGLKVWGTCWQLNVADFLLFCEERYGEKASQLVDGDDWNKYRNLVYVGKRVPKDVRKDGLTFDHYRWVAPLDREDQEYFLGVALENKMTTRALRELVDATLIERLLEDVDDYDFWKRYQIDTNAHHSELRDAISGGKEKAEKTVEDLKKVLYEDWWESMKNKPSFLKASEEDRMKLCWEEAVRRGR